MSLVGQNLGQYQITEEIGSGGMATVYKAYQPGLDRHVAIKVLPAQHALTPGFRERFLQEARVVANLNHPNILPVYDVGFEGDLSYYVMRYVTGRTLRDLLGQPMDLHTASKYVDQVCAALEHAHSHGIVHRDIKPANILLEDDWLLLSDFGLAKLLMSSQDLTGTGALVGTPAYLSPEQAEGASIDHRADIYSLGVVLFEMVIGNVPFGADTPMGVLFKHIYEPVPRPRSLRPDLPTGVEEVILKALAKDPADRFNRAGDLAEALRAQIHLDPAFVATETASVVTPRVDETTEAAHIFICYKRHANPDEQLANYLFDFLTERGHDVFIDRTLRTGEDWLAEIDQQIKASDFLIVLLSSQSADSEMVHAEIRRAYEYRRLQGRPATLPVRLAYDGLLPYAIDAYLDPRQYISWQSENDHERVGQEILNAIAGRLPQGTPISAGLESGVLAEDGYVITDEKSLHPPLPEFDPRFLDTLEAPGGVVKLRDKFYIERRADAQLKREVVKTGTTITIRASRQTGKSSLLVRGVNYACQQGARVVHLDLQRVDSDRLASPDLFLRDLADLIVRKLRLDVAAVDNFWRGSLGSQDKLTYLMEDYVLPESETPVVLALDEVDRLLHTPFHSDFFVLLRSWHNSRALNEQWDRLNMVMVISTEPYLLIKDVNQSPFNVGLKIYLEDFDEAQVQDLNQRHGSPLLENDIAELMKLLGGQPYLTRKALYTMAVERLTLEELMDVAIHDHGPFGDHLRSYHWLLRNEPALRTALIQVIEQGRCSDELALFRLLQAGLVKGRGDAYTGRCDLYRMYFQDTLGFVAPHDPAQASSQSDVVVPVQKTPDLQVPSPSTPPTRVTLIQTPQEMAPAQDMGSHSMVLDMKMEPIFSADNDYLIENWLQKLNSEQLKNILSEDSTVRLLLTGFESFGGTSLMRGVTAKLMENFAKRRGDQVLVIRLESLRGSPSGHYQLLINENLTAPVTNRLDETELLTQVRAALSQHANTVNPFAGEEYQTFAGQSELFYQVAADSDYSAQSQAIANLIRQTLNLLEADHSDIEIQKALDYLFFDAQSRQAGQIILIIDRIDQPEPMERLLNSAIMTYRLLSVIVVSRREEFDRWPQDIHRQLKQWDFRQHYVRRLWKRDLDIIDELSKIIRIDPRAGSEEQQRRLAAWLDDLTYKARGSLALALRHLKLERNWSKIGPHTILDIDAEYVRNRELIEYNAHVQCILQDNWNQIVDESLVNDPVMADQARLGVYYIIEWIRRHPFFTRGALETAAAGLYIPISDDEDIREDVLTNLIQVLEEKHYLKYLSDKKKYRLVWRQPPPLAPEPTDKPVTVLGPAPPIDQPLNIALLGSVESADEKTSNLATQIALEILEAPHRLIMADRFGTEGGVRQKLASYWPLYKKDFEPEQAPLLTVATGSDLEANAGEQIIQASDPDSQIDQMLQKAHVIILATHNEMIDAINSVANLELTAKQRGVPVIPVGAVGGAAKDLWTQANDNLSDRYQGRIAPEDFARISPSQKFVPDIARSAVALAQQICVNPH